MQVFSLWDPTHRCPPVNLILESPIPFADLWRDAVDMTFRGVTVKVASTEDLTRFESDAVSMLERRPIADHRPQGWGSYKDAEDLRRWSFLQRTPEQRLEWLIEMLDIAYQSGAIKPRRPANEHGHSK